MKTVDTEQFVLTILETSDLHGNIFPIHYANNHPSELGLAKISTLIKQERRNNPHVLYIDNGDLIQGSPLSYYHARIQNKPNDPMVTILNHLGCDATVFGNHEFNYGPDVLNKAIRESDFPWISANIVDKQTQEPYYGKPYTLKTFNDLKVAIIGLTTQYIPNWENPHHIEHLQFMDAVDTAKRWVSIVKEKEQPDVIVLSYHGGFECDIDNGEETEQQTGENQGYRICMEVPDIDVFLTGHQHRAISEKSINGITIVQPGSGGTYLGKVQISLVKKSGKWTITDKSSSLLAVKDIAADPEILQMVKSYEDHTQQWLDQPIGKIKGDMLVHNPMDIRLRDNALIEFFNKVQMENAKVDISNTALFDNRSPGLNSDVTMRDVVSNYIYPNTLRVLRVTGQDIKDALEQSASYFEQYDGTEIKVSSKYQNPKPQHYNYDMWEGIEYKINISNPVGERIVHLSYKGQPLDMTKEYDVVMNNYRAGGGGNFFMFRDKHVVADIPTDVSELIANYILERGEIEATVNHNWEVIHD
ncbi:MAG TPA: bifunctional UDP-sugar hydrolase/5'-nucleotidase [Bacillota bacterium]|nr:bifunctional UDP-sugar hydrolase/5'-nucleotidase [Bacillota bacterium]